MLSLLKSMGQSFFILLVFVIQVSCSASDNTGAGESPDPSLDSDSDGLTDVEEVNVYATNPKLADTDTDGLSDGDEVNVYATDPLLIDTDKDSFNDRVEVAALSDPLDDQSLPIYQKYIRDDLDLSLDAKWVNDNNWIIETDLNCRLGGCLKSPFIRPGTETDISLDIVVNKGYFQFDIVVDNACCNKVDLYVDDVLVNVFENGSNLTSSIELADGPHQIKWLIDTQNNATMEGAVLIDNIRFAAFATSTRNLSIWPEAEGLIFSNDLTEEIPVLLDGGRVVGTGAQFDIERGVNPGVSGGVVFNDFQESLQLANKGSVTFDITPAALTIDESESSAFTQSSGTARNVNAPFFAATPMSGETDEKIHWYRHVNGSLGFWEKSNATDQVVANLALSSLGKADYTHLGVSWEGSRLEFYVDGLLYRTLNRNAVATGEAFQKFYLGHYASKYIGDYWIKNFKVYSEPVSYKELGRTVGILGDSFTVAGFKYPFGLPRYDISWGYQMQKYLANENLSAIFYPSGKNGHGYSLSNPQTLTDYVDALLANNPDVVFCLGSVNDILNGVYKEDYKRSWEWVIDRLANHPSVKRIIVTSIPPFTKVPAFDVQAIKDAQLKSNAVISELPNYNNKVIYFDLFTAMNGFDYDPELSIGSAVGSNNSADLNPSPKGHVKLAETLYSVIRANLE